MGSSSGPSMYRGGTPAACSQGYRTGWLRRLAVASAWRVRTVPAVESDPRGVLLPDRKALEGATLRTFEGAGCTSAGGLEDLEVCLI